MEPTRDVLMNARGSFATLPDELGVLFESALVFGWTLLTYAIWERCAVTDREKRRWVVGVDHPRTRWFVWENPPQCLPNKMIRLEVGKQIHYLTMKASVFDMTTNTLVVFFVDAAHFSPLGSGITADGVSTDAIDYSLVRYEQHMADFERDQDWREVSSAFAELK